MKTIYLYRNILSNSTIRYLINLIKNKELIFMSLGDILINNDEFDTGYKIGLDTIFLFKSPKLSIKLFRSIISMKSITIIESKLFEDEIDSVAKFLNSLDENEYKYKLIYIKSGVINVRLENSDSINLLFQNEKKIIKIIENNI